MSLALLAKIIEDEEITDAKEKLVLLALADATNRETMLCYPSLARIALLAVCSRSTAVLALNRLEKKGWIQVIRRTRDDGAHLANTYRVIKYGDLMPQGSPTTGLGSSPTVGLGVVSRPDYVVRNEPKGSPTIGHQPIREPVIEPEEPARARARKAKLSADVSLLSLPLFLQGDDFKAALQDFIDHRKLSRRPMTQAALEGLVRDCEKWGKEAAIVNIYYSIKRGWQGVFPPKPEPRPPKDPDMNF